MQRVEEPNLSRKQNEYTIQFLLQESSQIDAERLRLRNEGIQRLNFFLTLTSALLGTLVFFGQSSPSINLDYLILGVLIFLAIVGYQFFDYSIGRDIRTDQVLRAGGRIRRYFSDYDPSIREYLTWQDDDEPSGYLSNNHSSVRITSQTVLSLLFSFIFGRILLMLTYSTNIAIAVGIIGFALALLVLEIIAKRKLKLAMKHAVKQVHHPKISTLEPGA